jgi:hypothetical protein
MINMMPVLAHRRAARGCPMHSIFTRRNPMSLSRKLMVHVLLVLMLFVGVSPVAAASANDHQVVNETVNFTIPADQCPLLPSGLSVDGTGERHMVVNTNAKADGTSEVRINDLVTGTATDSNGDVHKFVYHNSSTMTIPTSGAYSISMNDSFELTGPGPHYSISFNWRWTFTDPALFFPPVDNFVNLHGDVNLVLACDPI